MGWSDCGTDSQGRPIGYGHEGTCDHPGCTRPLNRGLYYACGGMHGKTEVGCEGYFCDEHRDTTVWMPDGLLVAVCAQCRVQALESGFWRMDEEEGVLREASAVAADPGASVAPT